MFCNTCGTQNPDNGRFCTNCGQALVAQQAAAASLPPPPVFPGAQPLADAPNDGKAVASIICGVLSVTFFSVLAGLPAIILGHMSRASIRKSMGKLKGDGLALAGLIMGYISFAFFIPMVLIVAAIAIPNLLRARMAANEASAVGSLRTINTAEASYVSSFNKGFSPDLGSLGSGGGACDSAHACLLDSERANGQKSGYRFTYEASDSDNDGTMDKYFVTADPITPGSTGRSIFCSDESGVIRKEAGGEACTAESPALY